MKRFPKHTQTQKPQLSENEKNKFGIGCGRPTRKALYMSNQSIRESKGQQIFLVILKKWLATSNKAYS